MKKMPPALPFWKRAVASVLTGFALAVMRLRSFVLKLLHMSESGVQIPHGSFIFGFPDEWAFFQKEHPKFVDTIETLIDIQQKIMKRTFVPKSPAEELIFFSGSLVMEEFSELWLLAGNGCGLGALKILRGMYERTVTAAYISKFPDDAKRFWDFGTIALRRVLNNAKSIYGIEELKRLLGADHLEESEKRYQEVRHNFEDMLCAKCEIFRVGFSWSKYDLATMAKKAGYGLENCYWHAYSLPTQQAHSTVLAITTRLKMGPEGMFVEREAEHPHAALAAYTGHVVLLKMLRVQDEFFALGLADEIAQQEAQCKEVWPGVEKDIGKGM